MMSNIRFKRRVYIEQMIIVRVRTNKKSYQENSKKIAEQSNKNSLYNNQIHKNVSKYALSICLPGQ